MQEEIRVRWGGAQDAVALADVFYAAIRTGPSPYSQAQRRAWCSERPGGVAWATRLEQQDVAVAQAGDDVAGFMTLGEGGYVDLAFIHPDCRGDGLFRRLYACIEQRAKTQDVGLLWTHASLMAEPAFRAMGFLDIHRETVTLGGESLARTKMEKTLG